MGRISAVLPALPGAAGASRVCESLVEPTDSLPSRWRSDCVASQMLPRSSRIRPGSSLISTSMREVALGAGSDTMAHQAAGAG